MNYQPNTYRKGFTLLEILIVGALIALFAGLAIFNVQETYKSNLYKSTIGEVRNLATAMSFANQDTGIYPKISLLMMPKGEILRRGYGRGDENFWFQNPDIFLNEPLSNSVVSALKDNWTDGAYFSASQNRKNISGGGLNNMRMVVNGQSIDQTWPTDPWGMPYAFYNLNIDKESGLLSFVTSAHTSGNFFIGIVSYGPDRSPGLKESYQNFAPGQTPLPLYGDGINQPFQLQSSSVLNNSARYYNSIAFILDEASDDIVYEF